MAKAKSSLTNKVQIIPVTKKTAQGRSKNTNLAATASNGRKKKYRGQGN